VELNTLQLPTTGTYTVLVRDCVDTNSGNYSIYAQRTNNPTGPLSVALGQIETGLIGSVAQSDSYTFSANANDEIDFTVVATSGALGPYILVYNPAGTLIGSNYTGSPGACSGSRVGLNPLQLPTTGTYTALVRDCVDANTGNYSIYAQRTNNPSGAIPLLFGGVAQSGVIGVVAQSNSYTFSGTASNVVDFTLVRTSGTLGSYILLYNPSGTLNSSSYAGSPGPCSGSTAQLNSVTLSATGTYTVLVRDCVDAGTGNYNLSAQCFGTCPVTPTITWPTPAAITYGTPLSATQLDATATVSGTTIAGSFVYTPPSGTVLSASPAPQTLSVVFTPTDTTDYTPATGSTQITVNKANPVCTWGTPAAITYGTALSVAQLNATCNVPGTFVYTPASGAVLNAGPQTLSVTFTPTDTTDYTTVTTTVMLTVNAASQTINFTPPASPVTYGVSPDRPCRNRHIGPRCHMHRQLRSGNDRQ
jgi:hypothetical protein